jgi:anti-sigma factor RsiW
MSHLGDEIAALVDGELTHDARDRALAHLARCDSCRAAVDAERRTKATLAGLGETTVPPALAARLRDIPAEQSLPARFGHGRAWLPSRRKDSRGPAGGRPARVPRRRRRRVRVAASGAVLVGAAAAAFAVGGGPSDDRSVTPQMDRFGVEHVAVTPEVPLSDQGDPAVVVSYPLPGAR